MVDNPATIRRAGTDLLKIKKFEFGVFIPIANNGWIVSRTAPQYMPTFDLNRRITELAEEIGFDFVFSMCKWRGYDGETEFWNYSLDSLTLMSALAAVTRRVKIFASVQPLLMAPAVAAKMIATIDDVSGGRAGVNIVTGAYMAESGQMGLLPDGYDGFRYAYATEWIEIVKRLWSEPSVTYHGK
jgi:pyrimidine oxygenase